MTNWPSYRGHRRAVGIGDARIDFAGRALGAQRQLGRLFGGDWPRIVQAQVRELGGQQVGVGQAGGRIGRGMAGDVPGGLDCFAQGLLGEIRGRGRAAALAGVDGQVERAVARLLDRLDIVLAHGNRQPQAFGDFGRGVAGAGLAGIGEHLLDQFGESRVVRRDRQGV